MAIRNFTKEELELTYAELGTIAAVARKLQSTDGCIVSYMNKYNIGYKHQVKYSCDHRFFSRDNEESFYWAGFIAADGCIYGTNTKSGESHKTLSIGLQATDGHHLELFKANLKAEAPVLTYTTKTKSTEKYKFNSEYKTTSSLAIRSPEIYDDLARFGITERKSLTLKFPEWLINHPLCHHFIRGYIDGDGCFTAYTSKTGRSPQTSLIICGTKQFLETIHSIFESNTGIAKRLDPAKPTESKCFKSKYGGNILMSKIVPYLYNDAVIFLDRKQKKAMDYLNYEQLRELKYILTKEVLIESYDRLQSIGLTAKELGVTDKDIKTYFKIHNIPIVDSYQEINSKKLKAACPKDLMEAAYLLYKGNITAVGRHFSIGKTTARRYLKQHGIIDDNSLPFPTR